MVSDHAHSRECGSLYIRFLGEGKNENDQIRRCLSVKSLYRHDFTITRIIDVENRKNAFFWKDVAWKQLRSISVNR